MTSRVKVVRAPMAETTDWDGTVALTTPRLLDHAFETLGLARVIWRGRAGER